MATRATTTGQQPAIDDGQPIDDQSPFIEWDSYPMMVDLGNIEITSGTDYDGLSVSAVDGLPIHDIKGELLNQVDGRDVGDIVIVGGGLTKLRRLFNKGIDQGRIKDGIRLRIEHIGMKGRMRDFKVTPNPIGYVEFAGTARDDKPAF